MAYFVLRFIGLEFELNSDDSAGNLVQRQSFEPSWAQTGIWPDKIGQAQFKRTLLSNGFAWSPPLVIKPNKNFLRGPHARSTTHNCFNGHVGHALEWKYGSNRKLIPYSKRPLVTWHAQVPKWSPGAHIVTLKGYELRKNLIRVNNDFMVKQIKHEITFKLTKDGKPAAQQNWLIYTAHSQHLYKCQHLYLHFQNITCP